MKYAREHVEEGKTALDAGNLEDALTAFRRSVAKAPQYLPGHIGLGQVLTRVGKADEAIREFDYVVQRDPSSAEALGGWARALSVQGHLAEAEKLYARALEAQPNPPPDVIADYAILLSAQKRGEAALALFERAAAEGGLKRPDALLHWGVALERAGHADEAITKYEAALALDPDEPIILNNLGFLMFRQNKDRDRALEMMERAVALKPAAPMLLHNLGWALLTAGRYEEAHGLLRRALAATSPKEPIYALRLQHLQQAAAKLPRADPPPDAPNIVLVVLDTLRADHLGVYGYPRPTSPHLDAFAKQGVVFERAVSQAPWTAASIASIMTGLYPSVHGLDSGPHWGAGKHSGVDLPFALQSALGASQTTLAEILRRDGYDTAGFISNVYVNSIFGFAQGFDVYDDEHSEYSRDVAGIKRRGEKTNERIFAWLDQRKGHDEAPFFLFAHFNDAHWPYVPPAPYGKEFVADYKGKLTPAKTSAVVERQGRPIVDLADEDLRYIVGLYDGEIQYLDAQVGKLLERLDALGSKRKLLVVVTADHGEEFLDHGSASHGYTLYDEMVHVPLIVRMSGVAPRHVPAQVRSIDIAPTILSLAKLPTDGEKFQGVSLQPMLTGGGPPKGYAAFSEAAYRGDQRAVASPDGWKMIRDAASDATEVYHLTDDPKEQKNLASESQVPQVAELSKTLEHWKTANSKLAAELRPASEEGSVVLDAGTQEQLKALGYIQ